jgi:hypothetical protein
MGDYASLPADDTGLENNYTPQNYIDVDTSDNVRVAQTATGEYAIHQFKNYIATNACSVQWEGQTDLAPTLSTVYLQIFNRDTSLWETIDSDAISAADTDFVLNADLADLTDYKDASDTISCRAYQLAT